MHGCRATFYLLCALVVGSLTADDKTAPVAGTTLAGRLCRCEDYRLRLCTIHLAISTGLHDDSCHRLLVALDDSAGGDTQLGACIYIYPAFEQICATGEGDVAGEVVVLSAIAQLSAVLEDDTIAVGHIALVGDLGVLLGRGFIIGIIV